MEDRDSVFVPKDLSKIKTKFLFGLTRRQCLKPCCARWLKPSGSDPGADRMKPTIPTPRSNGRCGSEKR